MSLDLSGKKVLFIGPQTFGYEKEIVGALERVGATVSYRSDKPGDTFLLKVILRLFPKVLWAYSDRVFSRWVEDYAPVDCDVVFIIKGEGLSPVFLDKLRAKYKRAKFVFYLWDSIKNVRDVERKFSKFDHLYSFDPDDCRQNPDLKYRPLFFLDKYWAAEPSSGKGCFFIGTLNGDRPAVISRLLRVLPPSVRLNYLLFVRNRIELVIRRFFDSSLRQLAKSRLLKKPMSSESINANFKESAVIVDIEHPEQVGLTMRTFEVLASGKKLITTNKSISSHEFFHPSRITVIDREWPQIDINFINASMEPLPVEFYKKYSLQGWLEEVLECSSAEE